MKVICTSDWQAAWYNLDQVRRAVNHILKLCKKHGVKTVIHCGDVKQQLNPVDIRVTNYMVSVIQRFKSEGIRLIFLLGNHDRVGMFDTAENWFPTLQAAGADTVDEPLRVTIDGYKFYMLPFMDNDKVLQAAKEFTKSADSSNSILVFHAELDRCMFNVMTKAVDGIKLKDLYPSSYM
jgi:Icc-related predicted phosphoesterase